MKADLKEKFILEYEKNNFNASKTCDVVGISNKTFYDWRNSDPVFAAEIEKFKDYAIELSELVIIKHLHEHNLDAAKFVLKTLGRKKGYGDTLDITSNGESINTIKLIEIKKTDGTTD